MMDLDLTLGLQAMPEVPPGFRSGAVAVIGRANVGKSTLVNRLVGEKVAIVSPVAQTTRYRILGVRNIPDVGQIAFVDTPGLHKAHHQLGTMMNDQATQAIEDVDVLLVVIDASEGIGPGDRFVLDRVRPLMNRVPVLAVFTKLDVMNKGRVLPMIQEVLSSWPVKEAVPLSALSGDNCRHLLDVVLTYIPEGPPHYPIGYVTDQDERRMLGEIVREKLLMRMRQEVPHAIAVAIERTEEHDDGLLSIDATIVVEKPSQKGIVIGAKGQMLKEVGTAARKELEDKLSRRVFLRLWVKVKPDWRDRTSLLRELGVLP